ncbi:MAG: protein translocase subunit SecD [Candidatus Geothermincolales bacterium]
MKSRRPYLWLTALIVILLAIYIPVAVGRWTPRLGLDLQGGISVTLKALGNVGADQIEKAADIIRRRVNALGLTEPVVAPQGNNRILVQIPGEQDPDRVLSIIGSTAQLQFREVLEIISPTDEKYESTPLTEIDPTDLEKYQALKDQEIVLPYKGKGDEEIKLRLAKTELTGDIIKDAQAAVDDRHGGYKILFELTPEASKQFADLTTRLVGKHLAIVMDYNVESFPTVNEAITDGRGEITGDFTREEARDLAMVLRMGALPVEFEPNPLVENVSASLGRDSLRQGLIAGLVGLALVLIFMLAVYRLLGIVTAMALLLFGLFMYGVIVLLGHFIDWSLTLAAIAGVVVSVGISADSSVVFFERLKEEVREGKKVRSSVDRAYRSAFRTIIAADAATFIAALILWLLAMGPVKGFAFTLGLSTVFDVFISYAFTRNAVSLLSRLEAYNRPRNVGVGREYLGSEA